MANNKQNIENLFKDTFKDYSITPKKSLWNKINRKLTINNFLKFTPAKFNIYYTILIAFATTFFIYNISNNNTNTISEQNNLEQTKNLIILEGNNNKKNINETTENIIKTKSSEKNILKETSINSNKKTEKKHTQNNDAITSKIIADNITKEIVNLDENINSKLAKPSAKFSASTLSECAPATITFTNASENCESYLWNFGNEETSSETNPTFVFKTAGKYTVTLTVYASGIYKSASQVITIFPKPKSEFIISDKNDNFKGDEVKFANLSEDFKSCKWDFGDGNTSSFTHPSHVFEEAGFYNISLICFSKDNCSDTSKIKSIQIKEDKYKIYAANAISPDLNGPINGYVQKGNYSKSIFNPTFNSEPIEYHLRIFNQFGSVVFESNDVNYGWNGYYNNKPAPVGVYIWECSGKFSDGQVFTKMESITVVHSINQ